MELKKDQKQEDRRALQKEREDEPMLVARSVKGDKDAYRILVERYQDRAFAVAFEIIKRREDAEDIVQEAFVKAYLSLGSFHGESSFFTWLYRIVHNMALDVRRKLARRGGDTLEYQEIQAGVQGEESVGVFTGARINTPQEELLAQEKARVINKALGEISEEHRSVMVLREIDGLSYDEIALAVGISKGTVMSRLFYARKKLQQALVEYGFGKSIYDGSRSIPSEVMRGQ
jgi:RNA polymerase sigma-70 factor (ECF subfamily)